MKFNSKAFFFAAVAAVGITFGLTSCDKDLLNVDVPMEFADITFTIPATTEAIDFADERTVETNIEKILSDNKVKKENIKSIKLVSLVLVIDKDSASTDTVNNFRILQSIKGEIAKDGGSFTTVGEVSNNPDVEKYSLSVPVSNAEFKDYLDATTFKFKVSGRTRGAVTSPITVKATIKFTMNAGI
ncbi:MAG: hypothetical protein V4616_07410 [Bacteroidota bacterium]